MEGDGVRARPVLDGELRGVRIGETELRLTAREYAILALLLSRPAGEVVPLEALFERIREDGRAASPRVVSVHICHLRRKLREATGEEYIETVQGSGYRLI